LSLYIADKIIKLRIIRQYGILVGLNTTFNLTLYSYHGPEWDSYHGFVHFVWTFDVDQREKPLLTWERAVSHVYTKPGKYKVKVSAINDVSQQSSAITIQVHGKRRDKSANNQINIKQTNIKQTNNQANTQTEKQTNKTN